MRIGGNLDMKTLATSKDIVREILKVKKKNISKELDKFDETLRFSDKPLRICFPWSAGSGKTTAIIEFIADYWQDGIIYSAQTREELNRVYGSLVELLRSRNQENVISQIKLFHANTPDWDVIVNKGLSEIDVYPVLLVTHTTLLRFTPKTFTSRRNSSHYSPSRATRKWCITDEKSPFVVSIPVTAYQKTLAGLLISNYKGDYNIDGHCAPYDSMRPTGHILLSDLSKHYSPSKISSLPVTEEGRIDTNTLTGDTLSFIAETLNRNCFGITPPETLEDTVEILDDVIYYDISKVEINHLNFDGTGDILFRNSEIWDIAENRYPYRFSGEFFVMQNYVPLESRKLVGEKAKNIDLEIRSENIQMYFEQVLKDTLEVIKMGNKPLVITWKDIQTQILTDSDSYTQNIETKSEINQVLRKNLEDLGYVENRDFFLTYWYSGLTRGTNKFKEADSVILVGKVILPSQEVRQCRDVFGSQFLTSKEIFVSEIIQAIYRTRVREGLPVKVFYSSDLIDEIADVKFYLNQDISRTQNEINPDLILKELEKLGVRKNLRYDIVKLAQRFGMDRLTGKVLEIKLNELNAICPRATVRKAQYKALQDALEKSLNCILVIQ